MHGEICLATPHAKDAEYEFIRQWLGWGGTQRIGSVWLVQGARFQRGLVRSSLACRKMD
jgi:hypothetical protein